MAAGETHRRRGPGREAGAHGEDGGYLQGTLLYLPSRLPPSTSPHCLQPTLELSDTKPEHQSLPGPRAGCLRTPFQPLRATRSSGEPGVGSQPLQRPSSAFGQRLRGAVGPVLGVCRCTAREGWGGRRRWVLEKPSLEGTPGSEWDTLHGAKISLWSSHGGPGT